MSGHRSSSSEDEDNWFTSEDEWLTRYNEFSDPYTDSGSDESNTSQGVTDRRDMSPTSRDRMNEYIDHLGTIPINSLFKSPSPITISTDDNSNPIQLQPIGNNFDGPQSGSYRLLSDANITDSELLGQTMNFFRARELIISNILRRVSGTLSQDGEEDEEHTSSTMPPPSSNTTSGFDETTPQASSTGNGQDTVATTSEPSAAVETPGNEGKRKDTPSTACTTLYKRQRTNQMHAIEKWNRIKKEFRAVILNEDLPPYVKLRLVRKMTRNTLRITFDDAETPCYYQDAKDWGRPEKDAHSTQEEWLLSVHGVLETLASVRCSQWLDHFLDEAPKKEWKSGALSVNTFVRTLASRRANLETTRAPMTRATKRRSRRSGHVASRLLGRTGPAYALVRLFMACCGEVITDETVRRKLKSFAAPPSLLPPFLRDIVLPRAESEEKIATKKRTKRASMALARATVGAIARAFMAAYQKMTRWRAVQQARVRVSVSDFMRSLNAPKAKFRMRNPSTHSSEDEFMSVFTRSNPSAYQRYTWYARRILQVARDKFIRHPHRFQAAATGVGLAVSGEIGRQLGLRQKQLASKAQGTCLCEWTKK